MSKAGEKKNYWVLKFEDLSVWKKWLVGSAEIHQNKPWLKDQKTFFLKSRF